MQKIKLMTDSVSDISTENEKRYGIQIVPIRLEMGGRSYVSRVDFDNAQFYKMMDEFDGIPVTSQITPYEFGEIFEEHYKNGYTDIIYVSLNSAGSSTHANSLLAASEFYENHPEAEGKISIYNIDSGTYTGCYGYAVVEAAKMIEEGCTAMEIANFIRDWCENSAAFFVPYTLKYAAKSGRIPAIAAHMGNALGIRPVMRLHDHEITAVGKVRSEKNIIPEVIERTVADMKAGSPYSVIYGSDGAVRDEIASLMTERVGYPPMDSYQIGAAIATNSGPKIIELLDKL
jgi:DegV family protein with EDD domain